MSENLQERPPFCDTPGLSKAPGSLAAKQCGGTDSMGQVKPDRPDIRSKALTDTDEKKKKLQKLGLTSRPSTEDFQKFFNKEANLNNYVKKYQMKMGNKTSTVDKDAWVDGIGGLSKKEAKTLKRQLQGHTREGTTTVHKFKKGQPDIQLDPPRGGKKWGKGGVNEDSRDKSKPDPKGRKHPEIKKDSEKAVGLLKKKGIPAKYAVSQYFGDRIYVQRDMEKKAKKIIPKDLHQYVFGTIDNPVQAGFRTNEGVEIDEVDSSGIDMYDNKRKESEMRKKARETPSSPETKRKLKIVRAGGTVKLPEGLYSIKNTKTGQRYSVSKYQDDKKLDKIRSGGGDHKHAAHYKDGKMIDESGRTMKTFAEVTTGLLKRAAKQAGDEAETQRDAQAWALKVPGKGHAFGAAEAGKKAAKKEKQAGKFSAAVDVRQRDTAFKKKEVENEAFLDKEDRAKKAARMQKHMDDPKHQAAQERKKKAIANDPVAAPEAQPEKPKQPDRAQRFMINLKKNRARRGEVAEKESDYADKIAAFKKKGGKVEKQPEGPISRSLFKTTVGREKRRNPGKQATRGTFYDEVEVKELGPIGAFVARAAIKHVAKKAIKKATEDKEDNVNEVSKKLLQRAEQGAKKKADDQRAVSKVAASRVGDTSQPPGQNIKSKRADFQAAKKDYQAFKFGIAAKKKERVDESNKLQANMALDDAGIKSYWEDGKLWVDKKDVVKAEKTLSKSFKKGGEPHIYYKGGFLGVWNKKRKLTG